MVPRWVRGEKRRQKDRRAFRWGEEGISSEEEWAFSFSFFLFSHHHVLRSCKMLAYNMFIINIFLKK